MTVKRIDKGRGSSKKDGNPGTQKKSVSVPKGNSTPKGTGKKIKGY